MEAERSGRSRVRLKGSGRRVGAAAGTGTIFHPATRADLLREQVARGGVKKRVGGISVPASGIVCRSLSYHNDVESKQFRIVAGNRRRDGGRVGNGANRR